MSSNAQIVDFSDTFEYPTFFMYILGVNACFTSNHHDPSVTLFSDGIPIFAIEEERLNRIKTSSGLFPVRAMGAALKFASISIRDISLLAMPGATSRDLIEKTVRIVRHHFGSCPDVRLYDHEYCHAAGAHFSSGFNESIAIAVDGYGDKKSGCKLHIRDNEIISASDIPVERSLGLFYGVFTEYLGYQRTEGEFKVMGMSAYGEAKYDLSAYFDKSAGAMGIVSEPKITSLCEPYYSESEIELFCKNIPKRRMPGAPFTQDHFDLAASVQAFFQVCYKEIILDSIRDSGISKVSISGGCALNCLANSFLIADAAIEDFYIQPAASDRGLSMGAAYLACLENNVNPRPCSDMYLGTEYSNTQIKEVLDIAGVKYRALDDLYSHAACSLKLGKILGWFQSRSEFGPRALGARSILADATSKGIKNKINKQIKFRESYRPFAPIISKKLSSRLGLNKSLEYMTVAIFPQSDTVSDFGDTIHADGSTRVQMLNNSKETPISSLSNAFEKLDGLAILNTSFNLAGEPLVESPLDAIRSFFSTGMDILYIGDFVIEK